MAKWINRNYAGDVVYSIAIKYHKEERFYFFRLKDSDIVDWNAYCLARHELASKNIELTWDLSKDYMKNKGYQEILMEELE